MDELSFTLTLLHVFIHLFKLDLKYIYVLLNCSELGESFNPERIIVTTCDADSYFHPNYISALTSKFLQEKTPHAVIFQAPLFYNWGLDRVCFVTRVTGLLRSTLMMGALNRVTANISNRCFPRRLSL